MGNRGAREYVLAFSLETGEKVWEYDNAAAYHNSYGDGPRSTPTLDGDFLYALGGTGQLVCLELESGKPVWKKNFGSEFGTQIPNWGICESVLIDGDRLICTPGGRSAAMAALDKKTGNVVWKGTAGGDRAAYASAIAVEGGGVRQYVNYTASGVIGMRADDGKMLWRDDSSANDIANCCAPVFSDGMVFTSSGYGKGSSMVALTAAAGNGTRGEFKYHSNDLKVHHGGLVLLNGNVYGANDNNLACLDLKTGRTRWQNRSVGKGSLTAIDGMLIVRSEEGPVALVEASPSAYKELSRFSPGERSSSPAWTYPVVCGGKLFLRDQEILQVYEVAER
jgi:outer membrane protein assembly factor BamB